MSARRKEPMVIDDGIIRFVAEAIVHAVGVIWPLLAEPARRLANKIAYEGRDRAEMILPSGWMLHVRVERGRTRAGTYGETQIISYGRVEIRFSSKSERGDDRRMRNCIQGFAGEFDGAYSFSQRFPYGKPENVRTYFPTTTAEVGKRATA